MEKKTWSQILVSLVADLSSEPFHMQGVAVSILTGGTEIIKYLELHITSNCPCWEEVHDQA